MAIQASELRLGNLVNTFVGKVLGQKDYVFVETNHIKHIEEGNEYGYEPIPLTEEWILKFGLTNVTEELDAEKSFEIKFGRKTFRVVIDDRGLCTVIYQVDIGMNFQELTDVEFVHEFQNLIFALCGEELKLN